MPPPDSQADSFPRLRGLQGERTGDVRLADPRRPKQDHVLCALDEGQASELEDLFARENRSPNGGTSIPATFLKVTVAV